MKFAFVFSSETASNLRLVRASWWMRNSCFRLRMNRVCFRSILRQYSLQCGTLPLPSSLRKTITKKLYKFREKLPILRGKMWHYTGNFYILCKMKTTNWTPRDLLFPPILLELDCGKRTILTYKGGEGFNERVLQFFFSKIPLMILVKWYLFHQFLIQNS